MAKFSKHYGLDKTQSELDFVNVKLDRDNPLFVDPYAISLRQDEWGRKAHGQLVLFFQSVIDAIRDGRASDARELLSHLQEPNETRLGLSKGRPQGTGIGPGQADDLFRVLSKSEAVRSGVLTSLEECELMIEGIGNDKISDLATNVLRGNLVEYTQDQCRLHGVPMTSVSVGPTFNKQRRRWENRFFDLPVANGRPILLVPKSIVRRKPAYEHRRFYRHYALNFLQAEHLRADSSLVRTLRDGRRVVRKKDIEVNFPCAKEQLFAFARDHPDVLEEYRRDLAALHSRPPSNPIEPEDEIAIARALQMALAAIPAGGAHAGAYHKLMIGIVEFVFFPNLVCPRKEHEIHEGRKRIDILSENAATEGAFHRLHDVRSVPCNWIPIECKNYSSDIANPELDQMIGRFSVRLGRAGIIMCRQFVNRPLFVQRCRDAYNDQQVVIVCVDDAIVNEWLGMLARNARADVDARLWELINEVMLP
jgi:hypothetical protein